MACYLTYPISTPTPDTSQEEHDPRFMAALNFSGIIHWTHRISLGTEIIAAHGPAAIWTLMFPRDSTG